MTIEPQACAGLLAGTLLAATLGNGSAWAAESYDNCTGFIDSVPAQVTRQGTWCLRKDLGTAISSGSAIDIAANNVTLDCNHFKLGGMAAGHFTQAFGVNSMGRSNITVRNCNIRGFRYGVNVRGASGHLVEDNRLDGNTTIGASVDGDGSIVRRNHVVNTGSPVVDAGWAQGIAVNGAVDVVDNTISGVMGSIDANGNANATGIVVISAPWGSIRDNRVYGLWPSGTGTVIGIHVTGYYSHVNVQGNEIVAAGGSGVLCTDAVTRAMDNVIHGAAAAIVNCRDDGNSL